MKKIEDRISCGVEFKNELFTRVCESSIFLEVLYEDEKFAL